MGQKSTGVESYLLYMIGLTPIDVFKLGICSKATAYKYYRRFELAKANIPKIVLRANAS